MAHADGGTHDLAGSGYFREQKVKGTALGSLVHAKQSFCPITIVNIGRVNVTTL